MTDVYNLKETGKSNFNPEENIFSINSKLLSGITPKELKMTYSNKEVHVDYTTGKIKIDGSEIDLNLPSGFNPSEYRWINFNRVSVSILQNGERETNKKCVIGWQTTYNGSNIKRMVAVDKDGNWELWDKK